jgi:hypothetical protein
MPAGAMLHAAVEKSNVLFKAPSISNNCFLMYFLTTTFRIKNNIYLFRDGVLAKFLILKGHHLGFC